jgi:hypothetical protein
MIPCVKPGIEESAGLMEKVMRTLGFDTNNVPERERQFRANLLKKFRSELLKPEDVIGNVGKIPGLGPDNDPTSPGGIPIPWAGLAIMGEKMGRGCEYKLKNKYVEPPYAVSVGVKESEITFPAEIERAVKRFDFGPGCRARRMFASEDPNIVHYWFTLWGTVHLQVSVGYEVDVQEMQRARPPLEGLDLSNRPSMKINPYLRQYEDEN